MKYLPGGIDASGFVFIKGPRGLHRYQADLKKIGVYECRTPEGIEELKNVMGVETDPAKNAFKPDTIFVPGPRLWMKFNWTSAEIGRVITENTFSSKPPMDRPCPSVHSLVIRYVQLMISKDGIYIVDGDPAIVVQSSPTRPAKDYPMTEIRLEAPIWAYPVGG